MKGKFVVLSDSITSYDGSGLNQKHVNALNRGNIFSWFDAKKSLENGSLQKVIGIGKIAIKAIEIMKEDNDNGTF